MAYICLVLGASLGALCRYGLQIASPQLPSPFGTLVANLGGCLLIGIVYSHSTQLSQELRMGIITGFLGSLTTLSSFSLDLLKLIEQKQWEYALGLGLVTVLGGLAMTFLGVFLGQQVR